MIVIAAVDERGGMTFNKRRQSRDRVMQRRILELSKGAQLFMNAYSFKLFSESETPENITVSDDFLKDAGEGVFCYVENVPVKLYEEKIEKVILFKWNRKYPGDTFFDIDLSSWRITHAEEFPGSSHEKITMEVYER